MPALPVEEHFAAGIAHIQSRYSVDKTLERLQSFLTSKGLTIFSVIDHSGEAAKVGMEMHPTKLVVFGSPKSGTPLMLAAPTVAIDLPLKALVWKDSDGNVWISYNSPEYLQHRHAFPDDLIKNISGAAGLFKQAAV